MNSVIPSVQDTDDFLHRTTDMPAATADDGNRQPFAPSQGALGHGTAQGRSRAGAALQEAAHGAASFVQDSALGLRRRATVAGETGTEYVRAHPLLSVVVAAGAGALIAELVRALARAR